MVGRAAEHLEDAYNAGKLHSLKDLYEEVLRTDVADDKSRILLSVQLPGYASNSTAAQMLARRAVTALQKKGLDIKNDQYVLDYKLLPLGAEEHWQSAVEQGAAPIAEGDRAGCIWLHVPVLVGEATGVTMLAVADYRAGNEPSKEEIDAMPRFTENELTEALFGRGDGQGSALGLYLHLKSVAGKPVRTDSKVLQVAASFAANRIRLCEGGCDRELGGGILPSTYGPGAGSAAISDGPGDIDKKQYDKQLELRLATADSTKAAISAAILESFVTARALSEARRVKRKSSRGSGWDSTYTEVEGVPLSDEQAVDLAAKVTAACASISPANLSTTPMLRADAAAAADIDGDVPMAEAQEDDEEQGGEEEGGEGEEEEEEEGGGDGVMGEARRLLHGRASVPLKSGGKLLLRQFGSLPGRMQKKFLMDPVFTKAHVFRLQVYLAWVPAGAVPLALHRDGPPLVTVGRLCARYGLVA